MEDLIDIQGLDYIGWWPLSLGWWMVILVLSIALSLTVFFAMRRFKYHRSWQYKAYNRLAAMKMQVSNQGDNVEHKEIIQNLSVEMRKIAMLTTKRESCAGLIGTKWLQWLEEHDPAGFAWTDNGTLLVNMQYMPDSATDDLTQISKLITAAQGWVEKC